jgi:membrane-anchored protein YejM (alkaline phosphatase superfamily)
MSFAGRSTRMALLALLSLQAYIGLDARYKDFSPHAPSVQLAGNGWFEFLHAFWHNEIDYPQFYRTLPPAQADAVLRREFGLADAGAPPTVVPLAIARHVQGRDAQKRLNVVLISVESLSADFLGSFGNDRNLTPRLDALARESLLFTRLYATGTRTVRGLEAISLSLPPTPGHSVVKRPNNDNLYTLGEVFAEKGYEPLYIYGGYSYFDNMKTFFAGNGYTVVDRAALPREDVHDENIWGVADEDLFTLALRQLDARHRAGRPFFAHIMTTSNHRPFSYPAGRIDLPAGSREGAVKYTDWAIGNFIDRARETPWFDDTVFVILADHCASSRGRTELPIDRFHIPLLIYAPRHLAPARIEQLASQIDVGPTLLGLLNFNYTSRFFGQDILAEGQRHQRALLANYQTVGYLRDGVLVELRPKGRVRFVDAASGAELPATAEHERLLAQAIAYYQSASDALRSGALRVDAARRRDAAAQARPAERPQGRRDGFS